MRKVSTAIFTSGADSELQAKEMCEQTIKATKERIANFMNTEEVERVVGIEPT